MLKTTAKEVAEWMLAELKREEILYQETAVCDIEEKFGKRFTYENPNGNPAITPKVLEEFRKLSRDSVVWDHSERYWRFREKHDQKGRQQD